MLDAVLFDWGYTLMDWRFEDELIEAGYRAGLEALGRDDAPAAAAAAAARFRDEYLPTLWAPETVDELEYAGLVREVLGDLGAALTEDEVAVFLEAEHAAWAPSRVLGATTHALLDALRDRNLRLALVSNALDPPWLLERDLAELGVAQRLDAAVFSSEVGKRKPHPLIFETALERVGVPAERALFVGDDLRADVGGASALGMKTVQALWFRADDQPDGREPDFQAFTQMDVLNVVRRLRDER